MLLYYLPQVSVAYGTVGSIDTNAVKEGVTTHHWDTHFKESHMIIATATQKHCSGGQNNCTYR